MKLLLTIAAGVMAGLVLLPMAPLIGLFGLGVWMMNSGPAVGEAITNAFNGKSRELDAKRARDIAAFAELYRDHRNDPKPRGCMQ